MADLKADMIGHAIILDQVWLGTDNLEDCQKKKLSFAPDYITSFPPTFVNCSTEEEWFYDSTYPLYQVLKGTGIETEFICESIECEGIG